MHAWNVKANIKSGKIFLGIHPSMLNFKNLFSPQAAAAVALIGAARSTQGGSMRAQCSAPSISDPATLKKKVGYRSVDDYVQSKMVIGLGTGSTAYYAVERIGQKLKSGELTDIIAIPTSEATKKQALGLGIPLSTLNEHSRLDVTIDGM